MSLFRKCSFSNGDDTISISKTGSTTVNREFRLETVQSARSSCSDIEINASDYAIIESCVARNFPKHKSSHLRFLSWVAFTRRYTDEYITEVERRTCPLLWCRDVFQDEDAMLRHLMNCPHLSKGLYWCFHCQKPERVGRFQCRRCQGIPSTTEKMASVAKKIFSKLGAKAHRNEHSTSTFEYGKSFSTTKFHRESSKSSSEYHTTSKALNHDPSSDWNIPELPNTSINELPDSYISEMTGTEVPVEMATTLGDEIWADNFYAASLEEWDIPPQSEPKARGNSPKLARLDTSFTSLNSSISTNHGHGLQINHSGRWPESTLSSTAISPLSPGAVFSATEISPTDSETSGKSFFTDSGYSSATTTISTWNLPALHEQVAESEHQRGKRRTREDEPVFEDWIHDSAFSSPSSTLVAAVVTEAVASSQELQEVAHPSSECMATEKPKLFSPHWCDGPTLVHCFSEALDAHIDHTKAVLRELPSTPITAELLAMSKTSMVSIGLEVLAGIMEGRNPTAIIQVFAFTHIACAFVIAIEHEDAKVITEMWFKDILSWVDHLASARQRHNYLQIARSTWKPLGSPRDKLELFSTLPKENNLLTGCKHFLDVLESFGNIENTMKEPEYNRSNFTNLDFPTMATSKVIEKLKHCCPAFVEEIRNVERRLLQKQITNARLLELELICAGKLANQSDSQYTKYLGHVAKLCDTLYTDESRTRTPYYIRDINYVKQILPEENYNNDNSHGSESHDHKGLLNLYFHPHDIETSLDSFIRETDDIIRNDYGPNTDFQHAHAQPISRKPLSPSPSHNSISRNISTSTHRSFASTSSSIPSHQLETTTSLIPTPMSQPPPPSYSPPTPTQAQPANKYRCHCGYIPSGEEKWKASNLRRHKRTQHASDVRIYACRYPGCVSTFTRSDNMRSHQRDKGHVVLVGVGLGEFDGGGKRRKVEVGGDMELEMVEGGEGGFV